MNTILETPETNAMTETTVHLDIDLTPGTGGGRNARIEESLKRHVRETDEEIDVTMGASEALPGNENITPEESGAGAEAETATTVKVAEVQEILQTPRFLAQC